MRIISYRIVTNHLIYTPIENMSVVWERHGLLDIATVTKEHGFLRRINCNRVAEKWSWSTKFWLFGVRNLDCWCHRSFRRGPFKSPNFMSLLCFSPTASSVCATSGMLKGMTGSLLAADWSPRALNPSTLQPQLYTQMFVFEACLPCRKLACYWWLCTGSL